jgi:integrase
VSGLEEFASEWYGRRENAPLRPKTLEHLRWCLTDHLLPTFRAYPLDRIDAEAIDAFTARKRRGGLSATSCNRLVRVLAAILEDAVEYDLIGRNRRRASGGGCRRASHAGPISTGRTTSGRCSTRLASSTANGEACRTGGRWSLGGLRIGECLDLRWRDVQLANGRLVVCRAKTAAGERTVDLLPLLRDELATLAAVRRREDPDALVFATGTGCRHGESNVRRRVLAPAVERANERLAGRRIEPLPERLTPHSLRRTFASLLYAIGDTPPRVMAQMGHTSPQLALAIYAREMDRRDGEPECLRALVNGGDRALTGTDAAETLAGPAERLAAS